MPFDSSPTRAPLKPGLAGLAQLRDELRKPMPEGFRFYYPTVLAVTHCGTAGCAWGLARFLWLDDMAAIDRSKPQDWNISQQFGISRGEAFRLFIAGWATYRRNSLDITEAMVADEIDKLLKEKGFAKARPVENEK